MKLLEISPRRRGNIPIAGGERFQVTGIDPRRPKYPISVARLPDRKGYKFGAENVVALLKAQAKS